MVRTLLKPPTKKKSDALDDLLNAEPTQQSFPKTLAECVDLLYDVRQERLKKDREAEAFKKREADLTEHIIRHLSREEGGVIGRKAKVERVEKIIPTVEDWNEVWKYIVKNKAFDLVQKRLGNKAVEERWSNGKKIPGIKEFRQLTLSVTKK